ncbi:hypothetical protein TspCOW1_06830 [Thiohalobacter sp. COW1]|uniref:diguanylate cyclase n=1 Tax=Thiohalobacter thiocyanaticus TaxID=585455 RepID=A0A1Z4VS79_9GAMM|nr:MULTISPECIES: GGDEF domain-containing protein [Thiohalobacter]BAZ94353.1 putative diguanylate cyclase [Thiohalobacter thiocyanaticus]BCO30580.1 hypothetical protein TspCOW1_06830 [Thiohalobacter sp. COW1]
MGILRRRSVDDRRSGRDRRWTDAAVCKGLNQDVYRFPDWSEQLIQFLTRYLFFSLGILFFNFTQNIEPVWLSRLELNIAFGVYFIINTLNFLHASRHPICPARYHFAMWVDIAITAISVLNDPYAIPPSLLVFIMVVLGNGMRYGMRLFGEAVIGCFGAVMLVFTLRYSNMGELFTPGMLFLNLFGGIILVYAYILMGRIEQSRRQLEHNSRIDPLTGLMNRGALMELSDGLFQKLGGGPHRAVVMFADMDKFKQVNDTYGHGTGDEVLRRVAEIMRGSLRGTDLAARIGGDEFVLVLTDITLDEAELVATRIQEQIAQYACDHRLPCSVTIALGEAPTHGRSLDAILDHVDRALYKCKRTRNCTGIMRADLVQPEQVPA